MLLFFDTETTGLWIKGLPIGSVEQPKIVQIAAILTDDVGTEIMSTNLTVYQEHVPDKAAAVHGKTTEFVGKYGINEGTALTVFEAMLDLADTVVAHNGEYDEQVVRNAIRLLDGPNAKNPFEGKKAYCTMRATTPLCKLPGGRGGYKWPKLTEAHQFLFGCDFDGAHDALADVRACMAIYFKLQEITAANRAARAAAEQAPQ